MVGAIRVISIERGHDPRDFTLVAFGGAGPLHGCALAELLGIKRVLIPAAPGVLCAEGLLAADLKSEFDRTLPRSGKIDADDVAQVYAELEAEAQSWFDEEGVSPGDRRTTRIAMLRYHGQGGELTVPWGGGAVETETAFATAHEALYGFTLDAPIELVTIRVEAMGHMPDPVRPKLEPATQIEIEETRPVHFAAGKRDVPVLDRDKLGAGSRFEGPAIVTQLDATTLVLDREKLGAGSRFEGPAIVTQLDATTLVPPGWNGETHRSGALLLTRVGD
jgi:N-methylhydantoinase A